jgi:hypothetical protein
MAEPNATYETGLLDVQFFVNPETLEVEGCFAFNFMGVLERTENDWDPVYRDETRLDEFNQFLAYSINWDIEDNPNATAEEDLEPHVLVEAYDNGTIDLDMIKKYCVLVHDELGENPEALNQ